MPEKRYARALAFFAFLAGLIPLVAGAESTSKDPSRLCANVSSSQAVIACNQILSGRGTDSDRSKALIDLGYSYERNGDQSRALEAFTRGIEIDPKNANALFARGEFYERKMGNLDQAIADYTRAIQLSPNNVRYLEARAALYKQKGQLDLARADTKIAAELDPQSFSAVMSSLEELQLKIAMATAPAPKPQAPAPAAVASPPAQQAAVKPTKPAIEARRPPAQNSVSAASPTISLGKRVALVVGNSDYRTIDKLDNPANDARLMAAALKEDGFTLVGGGPRLDLDKANFDEAVQQFGKSLQGADVGLFYYAGHGIQVRGDNYLIPIDANPTRESDADFQMLNANLVLRQMEDAGTRLNLVMLDACRNNPLAGRGLRAAGGGLAQMQAPEGTLISFATEPGTVAQDGSDGNSPYTKALAEVVRTPGLGLFDSFNQVGLKVKQRTDGAQKPWLASSPIEGVFFFKPGT